jgi:ABC-type glutathione transport system ATPase component
VGAGTVSLPGRQGRFGSGIADSEKCASSSVAATNLLECRISIGKIGRLLPEQTPVLSLNLTAGYSGKGDVLRDIKLQIGAGEIVGLVGESGSGKSTLTLAVLQLLFLKNGHSKGSVCLKGKELVGLSESELREIRGRDIGLVLQSPTSSLNPALRIGTQLYETWRAHKPGSRKECVPTFLELLRSLNIDADEIFLQRKPSQISVGQAQRVLIAMAILHQPALVIADEPTSALDVITQKEVLGIFRQLARERNIAILFVSHDLLAVSSLCDRIAILRAGEIVESGPTARVLAAPQHAYTKQLVSALPSIEFSSRR